MQIRHIFGTGNGNYRFVIERLVDSDQFFCIESVRFSSGLFPCLFLWACQGLQAGLTGFSQFSKDITRHFSNKAIIGKRFLEDTPTTGMSDGPSVST